MARAALAYQEPFRYPDYDSLLAPSSVRQKGSSLTLRRAYAGEYASAAARTYAPKYNQTLRRSYANKYASAAAHVMIPERRLIPDHVTTPERISTPERKLKVLPGGGIQAAELKDATPLVKKMFAMAFVAVFLIGILWIVRVSLTDATMSMLAYSEQVSANIAAERLVGTQLELEYSKASTPAAIQDIAANKLGMQADTQVEYLKVTPGT